MCSCFVLRVPADAMDVLEELCSSAALLVVFNGNGQSVESICCCEAQSEVWKRQAADVLVN